MRTPAGDVNVDGVVDHVDLALVRKWKNKRIADANFEPMADLNNDGANDAKDEAIVNQEMGRSRPRTRVSASAKD